MAEQFAIGERVAVTKSFVGGMHVDFATIERDTKMYWVADGQKFRKSDLTRPTSSTWDRPSRLRKAGDPEVLKAQDASRIRRAYATLACAEDDLRRDRENAEAVKALRDAIDDYLAALSA